MRTALITGASRGIGRGIALSLAKRGYALTVTSRSNNDLEELARELRGAGSPDVCLVAADLAEPNSLAGIVASHQARHGSMNALVLNAGVGSAGEVATYSIERLRKTVDVNFVAALVLIKAALPLLRSAAVEVPDRGAKIVALSSITGVYAEPGLAVYGASKAALLSLIETVNLEESSRGVTATGIAPAFVATDMSQWAADRVSTDQMIRVGDVVAVVEMILGLSANVALGHVVMRRAISNGYCA